MTRKSRRSRPILEVLEVKLALSGAVAAADVAGQAQVGDNQGTYATLLAFSKSYLSRFGQPNYNPAFDLNHNGQIGQGDAKQLLHSLPPLSKKVPISLNLWIAPQDKAQGHVPPNSGGVTHKMEPTVLGHTTPGALIFTGSGTVDLKLKGPVLVANSQGNFSIKLKLTLGTNAQDFQVVDPYGQQKLRAFPIRWLGFSAYQLKHPKDD